jgi:putative ABC transport system substrate-binding protein
VSRLIRIFLPILCATLFLAAAEPMAQTTGVAKPFRIFAVVWRGETEVEQGFRDYLTQRGIPFEMTVRNLNLDRKNAPPIVEEIKRERPDLVYTWGTATTSSIVGKIKTDTPESFVRDIPSVFTLVAYPKASKLVESYESTGRSVTGVAFLAPVETQLKTILAYRPFTKIAVIYDKTAGNSRINVAELRQVAPKLDVELAVLPVPLLGNGKPDPAALPGLVEKAKREGAQLLYMGPDSFLTRHAKAYTAAALAAGLPTFASTQAPLRNSRAMFGLVTDYHTLGKLTALQAERILVEKRKPQDLPLARLARYKLWINRDVMSEIRLYPPMDMIAIADFKTSPGG